MNRSFSRASSRIFGLFGFAAAVGIAMLSHAGASSIEAHGRFRPTDGDVDEVRPTRTEVAEIHFGSDRKSNALAEPTRVARISHAGAF